MSDAVATPACTAGPPIVPEPGVVDLQRRGTWSIMTIERNSPWGGIDGAWVQDCIGSVADALDRAKQTSACNSGMVFAVVESNGGPPFQYLSSRHPIVTSRTEAHQPQEGNTR